jgi:hypothetical protein
MDAALGVLFAQWASRMLVRFLSTSNSTVVLDLSIDGRVFASPRRSPSSPESCSDSRRPGSVFDGDAGRSRELYFKSGEGPAKRLTECRVATWPLTKGAAPPMERVKGDPSGAGAPVWAKCDRWCARWERVASHVYWPFRGVQASSPSTRRQRVLVADKLGSAKIGEFQSQRREGWITLPDCYDDGGFTGVNMDRPALTRLLHAGGGRVGLRGGI